MNGYSSLGAAPAVPVLPAGGYDGTAYADKTALSNSPAVTKPFSGRATFASISQTFHVTAIGCFYSRQQRSDSACQPELPLPEPAVNSTQCI